MQQSETDTWFMPDTLQLETFIAALSATFVVDYDPTCTQMVTYADSLDWRLYQRGCILHCNEGSWSLYHGDSDVVTAQQDGPELHDSLLARDFPPGPVRNALEDLLGIRCLLPLTSILLYNLEIRLLNQEGGKTVARLIFETQQPIGGQSFHLIRLVSFQDYGQEAIKIRQILAEQGICQGASRLIGFLEGCKAAGRRPLDYSSKFSLELDADSTAGQAMAQIYRALLDNIDRNIPGAIAHWDTEFLHDLRVAIRRTRSGLSLVNKVLPEAVVDRFTKVFNRLGKLTGPTRDLDVYLQNREAYLLRLTPRLQVGLEFFFADLERRRRIEQKKLARVLRAKKTQDLLTSWRRSLGSRDQQSAPWAAIPAVDLASRIICKRLKQVLKLGRTLEASTADSEVHRLRIQCKKLRYTMEFFSTLYPKQKMQVVLRHLKKLQDILGSFNDLSVQQELLQSTLKLKKGAARSPRQVEQVEQAAALGALIQSLYQEQQALRGHFAEAFEQFGNSETTTRFFELFQKKQGIV